MKQKAISMLVAAVLLASTLCGCGADAESAVQNDIVGEGEAMAETESVEETIEPVVMNYEMVKHEISAGESKDGNPLKGLIPFQGSTTDFPHSMEWFYLPVNSTQVAMNIFDWTALEDKLNAAAEQGHQAVFRFYYDYPGLETGVPQFLIDGGLEMRPYDEPDDLGGGGLCPDYSDENLRKSMQNFIAALGAKYDGDSRIGYITVGLLGFWGEFHNWPFDEDLSDGKEDWSIPAEVYTEVLTAFDEAFDITPICAREPKPGVDNGSFDIGYHDDSFAYSTLSAARGGQDWSYGQRMADHGETDKWMTNCIGGEIYPPIQDGVFKDVPEYPDWIDELGRQDWNTCLEEAHPTWLMCDRIKIYQDSTRDNAIAASKQLGYDFRVSNAYFCDVIGEVPLEVKVDMRNIGIAPFYYDHTTWPVMIGLKQGEDLVARWRTEWDLSSVPADGNDVTFSQTIEKHGVGGGTYTLCIKVNNPMEGGQILGFANEGMAEDGWLSLGTITVEAPEKEMEVITEVLPVVYVEEEPVPDGIDGVYQAENGRIEGAALVDRDVPECSGGRKVGYIGKDGGSLYMENNDVAADGTYNVDIIYISGEDRTLYMTVNDGEEMKLQLPATGTDWTTLGTYTITLDLKAGKNTIHFYNNVGWAPDIDCIKIY